MIIATVDNNKVMLNFKNLGKFAKDAPKKALFDVGHELLRLSQREVPHDKGTLQNSGTVEAILNDVAVGYHTPYAARLHEHPEYRFQKGRKGKYLTDPLKRNKAVFDRHMGGTLETELSKAIK